MTPAPRRRLGRDGMLLAVMLSVPVLVLLGFRVAAAPADPPPVEERPLQLTTDGTSSTPTPSSTSTGPTSTSSTSTPTSSSTSDPTSTTTTRPSTTRPSTSASTRPTWTPTPSWTSRTDAPAPTYDDDDDGADDDENDDD